MIDEVLEVGLVLDLLLLALMLAPFLILLALLRQLLHHNSQPITDASDCN